jgi:hypothetical protein
MNESMNPNSTVWQVMPKLLCFKDVKSPITYFLFLALFVALQVTMTGFGKLVSVMEWDHGCSIDNLYGECESWFLEMTNVELSKGRKDVDKEKLYEAD